MKLNEYQNRLFDILLGENQNVQFLTLIGQLYNQGKTKKEIYELFLKFHQEIQTDLRTKENEKAYDILSDFMDGFTAWNIGKRILPDEPDI